MTKSASLPSEPLLGRQDELRLIFSYIFGGENRLNLLTCSFGDEDGLCGVVFSLPMVLRLVQSFLADVHSPVLVVRGEPGVGKSALLRAAEKRLKCFPGLQICSHASHAPSLLRRMHDGVHEVTDEDLMLIPVLAHAGRKSGIVLLLDEMELGSWLPVPLPFGVRCVIAPAFSSNVDLSPGYRQELTLLPLSLAASLELQQLLGLDCADNTSVAACNPLWLTLASSLPPGGGPLPSDLIGLIEVLLAFVEAECGASPVRDSLCALACSRVGLYAEELDILLNEYQPDEPPSWSSMALRLEPLLRSNGGVLNMTGLLHTAVCKRYLNGAERCQEQSWHTRLGVFFASAMDEERRSEAPYHFAAAGDTSALLESLTDWGTFSTLQRQRRTELVEHCRSAGGYIVVRQALQNRIQLDGLEGSHRRRIVASFLSQVGEFAAAKDLLISAKREALESNRQLELGRVCSILSENEVRYWDSLRSWGSVTALSDLLDNSEAAVAVFREQVASFGTLSRRVEFAQALTLWANGCFKAACVCDGEEADAFLGKADDAIATVETLFAKSPPSRVLGMALLVGGVSRLVRSHKLKAGHLPYRKTMFVAVDLFRRAESMLVLALGEVNEASMYTHANLGEILLYDVEDVPLGIVHSTRGCLVGIKLLGHEHPNVVRKLNELCALLQGLGLGHHTPHILRGDVSVLEELLRASERNVELSGTIDLGNWVDADEFSLV